MRSVVIGSIRIEDDPETCPPMGELDPPMSPPTWGSPNGEPPLTVTPPSLIPPTRTRSRTTPDTLTCGCGRKFEDATSLYHHQLELQHFTDLHCNLCNRRFSKASNFRRHNETLHAGTQGAHRCCSCFKTFRRRDNLQDHQLRQHRVISCSYCSASFPDRGTLREHVRDVHKT